MLRVKENWNSLLPWHFQPRNLHWYQVPIGDAAVQATTNWNKIFCSYWYQSWGVERVQRTYLLTISGTFITSLLESLPPLVECHWTRDPSLSAVVTEIYRLDSISQAHCRQTSSINHIKSQLFCPIHWSHVLSREWRCGWSSADRRCSNYIWVINNLTYYLCRRFEGISHSICTRHCCGLFNLDHIFSLMDSYNVSPMPLEVALQALGQWNNPRWYE